MRGDSRTGAAARHRAATNVTAWTGVSPLRLTGAARDDARMPSVRTAARSFRALAALAVLAVPAVLAPACGEHAPAPVVVPSDVHLAAAGAARPAAAAPAGRRPGGRRQAAGRRASSPSTAAWSTRVSSRAPADLCAHRRLWSRRALAGVTRFHFRSARVYAAPDARTLVLKARVRVRAGRGRPLPDGLAVLFFTLGRVGSAVGGWLITAVSTSP